MARIDKERRFVGSIILTENEQRLFNDIELEPTGLKGREQATRNGEAVLQLFSLLTTRNAIPRHRLQYFSNPGFNPRGRGKSIQQGFENNRCHGDDILRDPDFLKYFSFMINGAKLPREIISRLKEEIEDIGHVSSSDIVPLTKLARKLARQYLVKPKSFCDEFYKLALDLGFDPGTAMSFRTAVQSIR